MSIKLEAYSHKLNPPKDGVLLIDSGVGALSISKAINEELPSVSTITIGDQLHFPYGHKSESFVRTRISSLLDFALIEFKPRVVVIACNTASTFILPFLRESYDLPFVGVVPPVKPAAMFSRTKQIAVLSTKATSKRSYLSRLISEHAKQCQVKVVPCSSLADIAEEKIKGRTISGRELLSDLGGLRDLPQLDSLVLGCTHFSLIKEELHEFLGEKVKVYDPSLAVAQQVCRVYGDRKSMSHKASWFLSTSKCEYSNKKSYQQLGIDQLYCI